PADVLDELAARGELCVSDQPGLLEGESPAAGEAPPRFVLKDGSPLTTVLRHRAAPRVLRELAAALEDVAPVAIEAPRSLLEGAIDSREPPADPSRPSPWRGELWQALRSLFRREEPATIETPLSRALHEAIAELELEGFRVREVVEARSGPALRFE